MTHSAERIVHSVKTCAAVLLLLGYLGSLGYLSSSKRIEILEQFPYQSHTKLSLSDNLLNLKGFIGLDFLKKAMQYLEMRLSAHFVSQKVQKAVGYLTIPISSTFGLKRLTLVVGIFLVDLV